MVFIHEISRQQFVKFVSHLLTNTEALALNAQGSVECHVAGIEDADTLGHLFGLVLQRLGLARDRAGLQLQLHAMQQSEQDGS